MKNYLFILFLLLCQITFSQSFNVETIIQSGSNDSRINLVFLPDGYQANELDKFIKDATDFSNKLFRESPYKEYKNYFNIHAIKIPSNQSGANHPGNATDVAEPVHPVLRVDNYFESTFDTDGIHRLLASNNSTAMTVLANNFPTYDVALIIVNSTYHGGSGGQVGVSSLDSNTVIHELGHSFADLNDEYYAGDIFAKESINMTQETDPSLVTWKNWMGTNNVGIYQHCCGGNASNWYKPHEKCKMQFLESPFCAICMEGTIEKIHALTSPVIAFTPENTGMIDLSNPMNFKVNLIESIPNSLDIEWTLNGDLIEHNTSSVFISPRHLLVGSNALQVTIKDTSPLLKIDNHETIHIETILWNINTTSSSVDDISENYLKIELFPNPTQDILYFNLTTQLKEDYTVTISDVSGKQIFTKNIHYLELHPQVKLSPLRAGIYFINFSFENGLKVSGKIIKI